MFLYTCWRYLSFRRPKGGRISVTYTKYVYEDVLEILHYTSFRSEWQWGLTDISFPLLIPSRNKRSTEHAAAKFYFAAANFKNASAFGVKRLGVLIETSKSFCFFCFLFTFAKITFKNNTMEAKGKIYVIIILAILSLVFTVWCLMDKTYYLAVFGLFLFILQVYNYFSINSPSSSNTPTHNNKSSHFNYETTCFANSLGNYCKDNAKIKKS